jgi:hypothetical protein
METPSGYLKSLSSRKAILTAMLGLQTLANALLGGLVVVG